MVIVDANEELLLLIEVDRVVIVPAIEDEVLVKVVLVVVILAANDALLVFTTLVRLFIEVAALELFVVTVPLNDVMEDFNEEEAIS